MKRKKGVRKWRFCEKLRRYSKKEVSRLESYAEVIIIIAVTGFVISIALKLFFPDLDPTEINSLTAYRFSTFLVLLGLVLLFHRQKENL